MDRVPRLLLADAGLWVIDKPAGWLVHPAQATKAPDLVTFLGREGARLGLTGKAKPMHRLDLETSGLVLFAGDETVAAEVRRWFRDQAIEKTYLALVFGRARKKGIVRRPLQDARRKRPLEAVTRYRTKEWLGGFTLVAARPEHGRKHQIRRHLHGVGHAIVGDDRYHPKRFRAIPSFPGRLWLHAHRLKLPDGRTFESPLPEELAKHLEVLRAGVREAKEPEVPGTEDA